MPTFTQDFTATVSGDTTHGVTWSVEGGSSNGSIVSVGATPSYIGRYTSPVLEGNYTIRATSILNPNSYALASVKVRHLTIHFMVGGADCFYPSQATLPIGAQLQFTATYDGVLSSGVTWTATGGSITNTGLYTAGSVIGSNWSVTATSGVNTDTAQITIVASMGPPSISPLTGNPADQSVYVGDIATFSVSAQGQGLHYQWYAGAGTANPVGINSAIYTTPITVLGDSGSTFHVVVSNGIPPDAVSNTATLTVLESGTQSPSIITNPADRTILVGETATFSVTASGVGLHYQWYKRASISDPSIMVGTDSSVYTTPISGLWDSGTIFMVVVSNGVLPAAGSTNAILTVLESGATSVAITPVGPIYLNTPPVSSVYHYNGSISFDGSHLYDSTS